MLAWCEAAGRWKHHHSVMLLHQCFPQSDGLSRLRGAGITDEIYIPEAAEQHLNCVFFMAVCMCWRKPGISVTETFFPREEDGTAETNFSDYLTAGESKHAKLLCNGFHLEFVCVCVCVDYFSSRARLFT